MKPISCTAFTEMRLLIFSAINCIGVNRHDSFRFDEVFSAECIADIYFYVMVSARKKVVKPSLNSFSNAELKIFI